MRRQMGRVCALIALAIGAGGQTCTHRAYDTTTEGAWTVVMDFEREPNGAYAVGSDAFDGIPDDVADTRIARGVSFSGAQSARFGVQAGSDLFGGIREFPTRLGPGSELWIRFRVYWPAGFDWTARPFLKFFRVHTQSPTRSNEGYVDWYVNNPERVSDPPFQIIKEYEDIWHYFGVDPIDDPRTGVWETYEAHYVFDTVPVSRGGRARVQAWKNGVLLADIRDMRTLETPASYAHQLQFSYWNGGAPKSQSWYVDDIRLTTVRPSARDAWGNPMIGTAWTSPPQ